jgi:hypothetical protein
MAWWLVAIVAIWGTSILLTAGLVVGWGVQSQRATRSRRRSARCAEADDPARPAQDGHPAAA